MKMISTYISLLLLGGFMLVFYYCSNPRPKSTAPVNKAQGIAKRRVLPNTLVAHPFKYQETCKQPQIHDKETNFSFINDVLGNILPLLKNLN